MSLDPDLVAQVFTAWVRASCRERPALVAIDGKTSRRSHDRAAATPPLHLVLAFATTSCLVRGQEAGPDKASERHSGAGRAAGCRQRPQGRACLDGCHCDQCRGKGHGRIEQRRVSVAREVDWLDGGRRVPGETRLPGAACLVPVSSRTELKDRCRLDTRHAVRGHGRIANSLHWVRDVVFADDQCRLREGHRAQTTAIVRHFAVNRVRAAPAPTAPSHSRHNADPNPVPLLSLQACKPASLKLRRKIARWDQAYLQTVITLHTR